jgi:hypothetical protein
MEGAEKDKTEAVAGSFHPEELEEDSELTAETQVLLSTSSSSELEELE